MAIKAIRAIRGIADYFTCRRTGPPVHWRSNISNLFFGLGWLAECVSVPASRVANFFPSSFAASWPNCIESEKPSTGLVRMEKLFINPEVPTVQYANARSTAANSAVPKDDVATKEKELTSRNGPVLDPLGVAKSIRPSPLQLPVTARLQIVLSLTSSD